jgi:regulator of replication initiation timing
MSQISQEELQKISDLRSKLATVVSESGQLTLQVQLLQSDIADLNEKLSEQTKVFRGLLEEEQVLIKGLSEKYGAGQINFETGEFTPEK